VKGIGLQIYQRVLHPPQVPEELPSIEGERPPVHDTVFGVKDERPGLNDGRQREQEEQAEPPTKAGGKQPARHCKNNLPGVSSRGFLRQFIVERLLRSDIPGANLACIIASPRVPGTVIEDLVEVAPG
jgi:hypothetical protein